MSSSPVIAAHIILSVAGFSLAAAGAFANWYTVSAPGTSAGVGFFGGSVTNGGTTTTATRNPLSNEGAAAAMLIIGFVLGFFHFVTLLLKANKVAFATSTVLIATSALAFVTTFIGTVIGGQYYSAVAAATYYAWGAAFGCSIAATILQFAVLVLDVLASRSAAPSVLKSEAPTTAGAV